MKPTSSGVCPVFVYNLTQSSQTGVVVLEALVVTQVTPNVLFPGKQLLSLRLSELALLLDTSLEICCSFADALSSTTQTNDDIACSLDVPQQNASSSSVSVQLVSCKTLESVSSSFERFIQRLIIIHGSQRVLIERHVVVCIAHRAIRGLGGSVSADSKKNNVRALPQNRPLGREGET